MADKICRDCGRRRPISEFTANRNSCDGFSFYCKEHARRRHRASRDKRTGGPTRRHPRDLVIGDGMKWCPDCAEVLPVSAFGRNAGNKSGINSYCRPCHNARGRLSKEAVGGERTYHLRRRYGITRDDVDAMLAVQGGLCAICGVAPAVHVDHDHATGRVRALLCFNCNGGLGQFRDDPAVLRQAADYVERHGGHPTLPTDELHDQTSRQVRPRPISLRFQAMCEADARRATAQLPEWLAPAAER